LYTLAHEYVTGAHIINQKMGEMSNMPAHNACRNDNRRTIELWPVNALPRWLLPIELKCGNTRLTRLSISVCPRTTGQSLLCSKMARDNGCTWHRARVAAAAAEAVCLSSLAE